MLFVAGDQAHSREFSEDAYAATEKVADLTGPLSARGAPEGCEPLAGDVADHAPWGNLAIFHEGFAYSSGLVRLEVVGR